MVTSIMSAIPQRAVGSTGLSASDAKPRNVMIDCAKGVGILLIVLMHNGPFSKALPAVSDGLFAFVVSFFFFLSGVTFSLGDGNLRRIAWEKADALLKPCLVVILLIGVAKIVVGKASIETLALSMTYLAGFTIPWPPLWFIPHLWLVCVFSAIVIKHSRGLFRSKVALLALFIVFSVLGFFLINAFTSFKINPACMKQTLFNSGLLDCGLPLSADLLFISSSFFLVGYFLSARIKAMQVNHVYAAVSVLVLVGLCLVFPPKLDMNIRLYPYVFVGPLKAIAGIVALLYVALYISKAAPLRRAFSYCGKASLFILIFHSPLVFTLGPLLSRFTRSDFLVGLAVFILPTLISLALYHLCSRYRFSRLLMLPVKTTRTRPPQDSPVIESGKI